MWGARQFWATAVGVGVGLASLILLALTVYYAKKAADAASEAADAANATTEIMIRQELPVLYVSFKWDGMDPSYEFRCRNSGRTSAHIYEIGVDSTALAHPKPVKLPELEPVNIVIASDEDQFLTKRNSTMSIMEAGLVRDGVIAHFVFGRLRYVNHLGQRYELAFCRRIQGVGSYEEYPPEYNYLIKLSETAN